MEIFKSAAEEWTFSCSSSAVATIIEIWNSNSFRSKYWNLMEYKAQTWQQDTKPFCWFVVNMVEICKKKKNDNKKLQGYELVRIVSTRHWFITVTNVSKMLLNYVTDWIHLLHAEEGCQLLALLWNDIGFRIILHVIAALSFTDRQRPMGACNKELFD